MHDALLSATLALGKSTKKKTTSGQRILTKGRIADLSPLEVANGFARPRPRLIPVSKGPQESAPQTASRSVQPLVAYTAANAPNAFQ